MIMITINITNIVIIVSIINADVFVSISIIIRSIFLVGNL